MITIILKLTEAEHESMRSGNLPMSVLEKLFYAETLRDADEVTE